MSRNVQCLPVRASSTVRFPFLSPSSFRSWPSRPVSPIASIQDRNAGKDVARTMRGSRTQSGDSPWGKRSLRPRRRPPLHGSILLLAGGPQHAAAAVAGTAAVAIGCLSAPAKIVTPPSCSIRTAISAPTRLRLSARIWPRNRLSPETRTSAFGALATTVPSVSRTTMSRMRTAVPPSSVRSICVPPTSTRRPLPKFSSMAEASHGVTTSSWMGPLDSLHHKPRQATATTAATAPATMAARRRTVAIAGKKPANARKPTANMRMAGSVDGTVADRATKRDDRSPPRKPCALPFLVRHAPRASPRPWCLGTTSPSIDPRRTPTVPRNGRPCPLTRIVARYCRD